MKKTIYSTILILLIGFSVAGTVFAEEPIINATASKSVNDDEVTIGDSVDFTLTVTNPNLDDNFTGVVITDVISDLLEYTGNSDPAAATYDAATRTVTWNIGDLDMGSVATLTVYTKAIAAGTFNNTFNGTYNVTVVDQPAYDEQIVVGYEQMITDWTHYPTEGWSATFPSYLGTWNQVNDWLNSIMATYPLSLYPDAQFYGPSSIWWWPGAYYGYAEIPTYGDDLSKPIYETVHRPATHKNETRYIDAILDPTIFVQGVINAIPEPLTPEDPGAPSNPTVSAATVAMQNTGAPLIGTILAVLLVSAGLVLPKLKQ